MDIPTILAEVSTWSPADRIQLAQAVWDTVADEDSVPDLTDGQKQELDRRLADLDANPNNVLTWDQIKGHVRRDKS